MRLREKYKKALVTGGAGFIGSNLVGELLKQGLSVLSLDDYSAGSIENLQEFVDNKYFVELRYDITDEHGLGKYFNNVDIVFHNAASKKIICDYDPRRDLEVNAKGTFNILECARVSGVKKVIHASSGSVYGEAQYFPQDENHPLVPRSYYGVSKLAGEKYAMLFGLLYNMDVTVLRYFHVYGPKQCYEMGKGGVVPIFCHRALNGQQLIIFGDGNQQRSFTYVDDVVNANIFVALDDRTKGECYNVASGIKMTVKELAIEALTLADNAFPGDWIRFEDWMPGDIKVFDVSNKKLVKLGFEFKTEFDEGLGKTAKWLRKKS